MGREMQRRMQHAGYADVVDVPPIAQGQFLGLVLGSTTPDTSGCDGRQRDALGDRIDGVEDFHVTGASTQVGTEVACHVLAFEISTFLVDLGLGPHDDAGNAKAALQATTGGEGIGVGVTFGLWQTFESGDRLARHLGEWLLTTHDWASVDENRAATALTRWRATIFGRCDVEFVTQSGQEMRVVAAHADLAAVDDERHGCGDHVSHVQFLGGSMTPR